MPLSESLTREEILHKYEPAAPIHVPSNNMTFEWDSIDTEGDREYIYEQADPLIILTMNS